MGSHIRSFIYTSALPFQVIYSNIFCLFAETFFFVPSHQDQGELRRTKLCLKTLIKCRINVSRAWLWNIFYELWILFVLTQFMVISKWLELAGVGGDSSTIGHKMFIYKVMTALGEGFMINNSLQDDMIRCYCFNYTFL